MSIRDFLEALRVAMCKLHEIQFSAPWDPRPGGC
jgi:hypothetical protein